MLPPYYDKNQNLPTSENAGYVMENPILNYLIHD